MGLDGGAGAAGVVLHRISSAGDGPPAPVGRDGPRTDAGVVDRQPVAPSHHEQPWTLYWHARCDRDRIGSGHPDELGLSSVLAGKTTRATRKPLLLFRLSGSFLLRFAARMFLVLLFQEPPRSTRV